jgi:ribosomal-protein-alanine N-acetyltransferase
MVRQSLRTKRLRLRPSSRADALRAFEIRSDWEVARMLSMAAFPPVQEEVADWFGTHGDEWSAGKAYRFAVEHDGNMIGLVDLDGVTKEDAILGYWLERASWGRGFAFEAAQTVVSFAFDDLSLMRLRAGHAADNPASGRVLTKLGFRFLDKASRRSQARDADIEQWHYALGRSA